MILDNERNPIEQTARDRNITDAIFHDCLNRSGQSLAGLARKWGEEHPDKPTTAQNITNKIARDSMKLREFAEYLDLIGFDIVIQPRENATPTEDPKEQKTKKQSESRIIGEERASSSRRKQSEEVILTDESGDMPIPEKQNHSRPLNESERERIKATSEKLTKWIGEIEKTVPVSIDFNVFLIKGENANEAAKHLRRYFRQGQTQAQEEGIDYTLDLPVFLDSLSRKFGVTIEPPAEYYTIV